ncbi:hypothetical protein KSP40_PGU009244 [Platanthera guangdongensis]|uniref:Secreted peptide n=1 Tax=Platanthera guangdongensis TaxID=2320717 RepID=A0ABR2M040_9ASPA
MPTFRTLMCWAFFSSFLMSCSDMLRGRLIVLRIFVLAMLFPVLFFGHVLRMSRRFSLRLFRMIGRTSLFF